LRKTIKHFINGTNKNKVIEITKEIKKRWNRQEMKKEDVVIAEVKIHERGLNFLRHGSH